MATLNLQVAAGTDDCQRCLNPSYWNLAFSYFYTGKYDGNNYKYGGGMRFTGITIPQGATITSAYLTLTCNVSKDGTTCNTRISAEDIDNAPTFADSAAAFDSRYAGRTTAQVDWDNIDAWTADSEYNSPDISSVIQEIVNRPGWAGGNAVVIFWEDFDNRSTLDSGNPRRDAFSYNGSSSKAPKLVINYTTGEAKTSGDSGSGTEAIASRALGATEAGSGVEVSIAAMLFFAGDSGAGLDIGGLLQSLFSCDAGAGMDGVTMLTGKTGSDLQLPPHRGKVNIPHKEVNL